MSDLELREAVAVEIHGMDADKIRRGWRGDRGWEVAKDGKNLFVKGFVHVGIPWYETDMGEAWKVFEKLDSKGWYLRSLGETATGWACKLAKGATLCEAEAETAPEAICKAALAAVRAK